MLVNLEERGLRFKSQLCPSLIKWLKPLRLGFSAVGSFKVTMKGEKNRQKENLKHKEKVKERELPNTSTQ